MGPIDEEEPGPEVGATLAAHDPTTAAVSTLVGSLAVRALAFLRLLVAARLLTPQEVGRFAVVMTVLGVFEAFGQPGIEQALIQRRRLQRRTVDAAWSLLVARGVALGAGVALAAPFVTDALNAPTATPLLRAAGLTFVLRGFVSPAVLLRLRDVDLGPQVLIQSLGALAETVATVALAAAWRSAWALVAGLVIGAAVEAACSYAVRGFRPRLRWDFGEVRPLLRFSRWLFASSALQYVATAGDDALVARWTGLGPLGLYRVSYRIASLPTTEISHVVGRVSLPLVSRRDEVARSEALGSYLRGLALVTALAGVASTALFATAPVLVDVVLGEAWNDATTSLVLLTVAGFVRSITATSGSLFAGLGEPQIATGMLAVRAVVLLVALAILVPELGIEGAAAASILSVAAMLPPWLSGLRRVGQQPAAAVRTVLARVPALVVSVLLALPVARGPLPAIGSLAAGATAALLGWLGATWLLDPMLWHDLCGRARTLRARLRP